MKKLAIAIAILASLYACSDADVASRNLSKAADQFEASKISPYQYRVVFKPMAIIPDLEIAK